MNMNDLARKVAKKEKGKEEISIAQIKEVLAILSDLMVSTISYEYFDLLIKNGVRRLKIKRKAKK